MMGIRIARGATPGPGWMLCAVTLLVGATHKALGGAVYEQKKPTFSNPQDYIIEFPDGMNPDGPADIKVAVSPFNATANQMRYVTFKKCGGVAVHFHPRGNEQNYIIQGALQLSMFREDGTRLDVVVKAGQGLAVPQGIVHYGRNIACYDTILLSMSDYPDPGAVYLGQALMAFPQEYLKAALKGPLPTGTKGNVLSFAPCTCDPQYGTGPQ